MAAQAFIRFMMEETQTMAQTNIFNGPNRRRNIAITVVLLLLALALLAYLALQNNFMGVRDTVARLRSNTSAATVLAPVKTTDRDMTAETHEGTVVINIDGKSYVPATDLAISNGTVYLVRKDATTYYIVQDGKLHTLTQLVVLAPTAAPIPTSATPTTQALANLDGQIGADGLFMPADGLNPYDNRLKASGNLFLDQHNARLLMLEETYIQRDAGSVPTMESVQAWMKAAGASWNAIEKQARQVEEETIFWADGKPKIVVAGVQLLGSNFHVTYPSAFTTDRQFTLDDNGYERQVAEDNPSHIVTNATISNTLTFWADASNWHEIGEALGVPLPKIDGISDNSNPVLVATPAAAVSNPTGEASCPNYEGFAALGDIAQVLVDQGQAAGVQITFKKDWTPPASCVDAIQLNGSKVPSAPAGQKVSVWMLPANRPLAGAPAQ